MKLWVITSPLFNYPPNNRCNFRHPAIVANQQNDSNNMSSGPNPPLLPQEAREPLRVPMSGELISTHVTITKSMGYGYRYSLDQRGKDLFSAIKTKLLDKSQLFNVNNCPMSEKNSCSFSYGSRP